VDRFGNCCLAWELNKPEFLKCLLHTRNMAFSEHDTILNPINIVSQRNISVKDSKWDPTDFSQTYTHVRLFICVCCYRSVGENLVSWTPTGQQWKPRAINIHCCYVDNSKELFFIYFVWNKRPYHIYIRYENVTMVTYAISPVIRIYEVTPTTPSKSITIKPV